MEVQEIRRELRYSLEMRYITSNMRTLTYAVVILGVYHLIRNEYGNSAQFIIGTVAAVWLLIMLYELWRIFRIFRKAEHYVFREVELDKPLIRNGRIRFNVSIKDSSNTWHYALTGPVNKSDGTGYINRTGTTAYNEETGVVVFIG